MKKLTLVFCLSILILQVSAQVKGILSYKELHNDAPSAGPYTVRYTVYFSGSRSIQLGVKKVVNESSSMISENEVVKTVQLKSNSKKTTFVLKDLSKKEVISADRIGAKIILIRDTITNFNWKITNEHQKILKYNCTKATTKFRGRNYIAWFTDEVPVLSGPWKFQGLPGLIVKVHDDQLMYNYELEGIDLTTPFDRNLIAVPAPFTADKPITHKEFIGLYNKRVKELEALSRASVFDEGNGRSGSSKQTIPEKMEKF